MKMPARSVIEKHRAIRDRDKEAFAIAEARGIPFWEAWKIVLDVESERDDELQGQCDLQTRQREHS